MQPTSDPLIPHEEKATKSGYQAIEGGEGSGIPVETPKTLFSQVREAKEQSQGCCDFCVIFFSLLLGSIVWTIVMAITLTLPLAMLILGVIYINDCSAESMIPIFMIVAGCVLTVNNVMNLIFRYKRFTENGATKGVKIVGWITTFFNIFLMGWFFAGCYWVYHIHSPQNRECNANLYYFAYWLLNSVFLFFGTVVIFSALTMCLAILCW